MRVPLADIHARARERPAGYVEEVIAAGTVDGMYILIPTPTWSRLRAKYGGSVLAVPLPPAPGVGAGTELKKLLAWLGIISVSGCRCNARAREMDDRGCDWCAAHIRIIVGWLRDEHKSLPEKQRKGITRLPFMGWAARAVVWLAIRRAGKKNKGGGI